MSKRQPILQLSPVWLAARPQLEPCAPRVELEFPTFRAIVLFLQRVLYGIRTAKM